MASDTKQLLAQMVNEYGSDFYIDARKCKALLLDVTQNTRDANVLSAVVSAGIVEDLKCLDTDLPFELQVRKYAKRLYNEIGLSEDLAMWAKAGHSLWVVSRVTSLQQEWMSHRVQPTDSQMQLMTPNDSLITMYPLKKRQIHTYCRDNVYLTKTDIARQNLIFAKLYNWNQATPMHIMG